ncbi:MAG: hypothetical protein J7K51_01830 [Thermotogae bacterium]|nr:hypothetical protein [Thermotogota bacterium]
MIKTLIFFLLLPILSGVQHVILDHLSIGSIHFELFLGYFILIMILNKGDTKTRLPFALLAGLLDDVSTNALLGTSVIAFLLLDRFIYIMNRILYNRKYHAYFTVLFSYILYYFWKYLMKLLVVPTGLEIESILLTLANSALCSFVFYLLFLLAVKKGVKEE